MKESLRMAKEKVTKTSIVIRIMTEHKDKSMAEVVKLIETGLPCKDGYGKTWYRWAIKEGVAPGKLEVESKAPKAAKVKAPKVAKTVEVKPKGNRFTGKVKAETKPKDTGELAKIKAANLKRMQEVTAKMKKHDYLPGQYAVPDTIGVPEGWTAEGARAEVANMIAEIDAADEPRFLTKDQVKALV
jgi:hypothetical protein